MAFEHVVVFGRHEADIFIDHCGDLLVLMKPLPGPAELLLTAFVLGGTVFAPAEIATGNGVVTFIAEVSIVVGLRHDDW